MPSTIGSRVSAAALLTVFALAMTPAAALAQGSAAGAWVAEYPRRIENVNGEERVTEVGRARLTLELRGDSVIGVWQSIAGPNEPTLPTRRLRGVTDQGKLRLVSDPFEATQRTMDGDATVRLTNSFELALEGDTLKGTMQTRSADGAPLGGARPFSAAREKK